MNSNVLRIKVIKLASTHYFFGESILKLSLHKILRFVAFLKTSKPTKKQMSEMKSLKNSRSGLKVLVLGNGPSIGKLNSNALNGHIDEIIVVNDFYKMGIANQIRPSFYVLSDPDSFDSLHPKYANMGPDLRDYIQRNDSYVVAPHTKSESDFLKSVNKVVYFDDRELRLGQRISPLKPRSYCSVTLYKALSLAIHLGYSEINILGLDNTEFTNYRTDARNRLWNGDYEVTSLFSSGWEGRMTSYAFLFYDLEFFRDYPILNLDGDSMITKFPKNTESPLVNE